MTPQDLVVVLPGIMGSTLQQHGQLVWAASAGSVLHAIRTLGGSIKRLQLPDDVGDQHPGDGVEPVAVMPDLHVLPGLWTPVKGYDPLLDRLRSLGYREGSVEPDGPPGNLLPVAYDWRLSNRWTGQWLGTIVEPALERWRAQGGPYADARVVFVCHSMGGLVARWYIERCGGAEITGKLITLGTPYRGAARALEQLVNGVHKGIGPFSVDLTDFGRSLPSLHQLLPEYACIIKGDELAKTTETAVPELATDKLTDATAFHTQLAEAETQRPASLTNTHAIVGIQQSTPTTAQVTDGQVVLVDSYRAEDLFGDATVPIVGACRADVPMDSNTLRRVPDKHGNLHRNPAALDELEGVLTASRVVVRGDVVQLRVKVPDLVLAGQGIPVQAQVTDGSRQGLRITVTDETGRLVDSRQPKPTKGTSATTLDPLPPGAYTIDVTGLNPASPVAPVSSDVLTWSQDTI
jgi:hypothetical protein